MLEESDWGRRCWRNRYTRVPRFIVVQKMRDFVISAADVMVDGISQAISRNVEPEIG